ncbi:MAG: excinuclease ABC subunit UvrA, partial [Thermomicrobiales bacterium]
GLGTRLEIEPDLVVPNKNLSLRKGAIRPWVLQSGDSSAWHEAMLDAFAELYEISLDTPFKDLPPDIANKLLNGTGSKKMSVRYQTKNGRPRTYEVTFEGAIPGIRRRYETTTSEWGREESERFMATRPCPTCKGARLKPEIIAVTVHDKSIVDISNMPIRHARAWCEDLAVEPGATNSVLTNREFIIARQILKEIRERLGFLVDVGLDYLSLERSANTLSGGEAQRIRLATQIGSSLMGVLYILDEPSIGLHQRDNERLIRTLVRLRDIGNTLIIVEHDEDMMRWADWIIDVGPGAGEHGGHIVAEGTMDEIMRIPESITGQFLSGMRSIETPHTRRKGNGKSLVVEGATANNLRDITATFPLGCFIAVTGVSGSGKSTLITDTLHRKLAQELHGAKALPSKHRDITGIENLDKVIEIDQSPIGRTPRSNPATYTGLFTPVRELYASMPEAKARGYSPGRFSFNVKGGRCEACKGEGIIQIEMNFLPDVFVPCEVCHGRRYNREAIEITYKGKSIADVLEMTVSEGLTFFEHIPSIANKLQTLNDVGLGYIRLGQPATQLSGGEAQRVKLASELARRATGRTMYILDEPTTGLHFADIDRLLQVLQRLADGGNTILVIEHNLDVIKSADWVIDLGP